MKPLRHVMILASAGSGKTYALTNRFVELLARGAAPEKIVALTFTRKAAGEFFDEILNKLARAAKDEAVAAALARDIGMPQLAAADFRGMLRQVADAMHRLKLGTLDGFFARIARVFPFELGLTGQFEVLEEHAARSARRQVLQRMFTRVPELDASQKEFLEAFKRATFGAEEKQLGPKLDAFLDSHHERFLDAPDAACWGDPSRIWPEGNAWLGAARKVEQASAVLRAWATAAPIADRQRGRWMGFLEALMNWAPGVTLVRELEYVVAKALEDWPAVLAGNAVLEFDRKPQELTPEACAALAEVTRHVVGGELTRRLEVTRGIHAVLQGYDRVYHAVVRRAGKLTFGDVQRLLLPGGDIGALSGDVAGEGKLFIDYRLDAQIDHWLLDEFQDTSFGQWSVLRNLIDEVVQETSGARSFFCVGDVKQAIFAWREGDPRLFGEILDHYNAGGRNAIEQQHLVESWRSGPPVIELVNTVFSDAAVISELFPGPAAAAWNKEWRAHVSAVPRRGGHAAVLVAEDEAARWRQMVAILEEIRPLERGLTCAVLVPKNSTATEIADFLRREAKVPAVAESDLSVCTDNPLGTALLAWFQAAAHPGDTLAWEHVRMSPLGALLAAEQIGGREAAVRRVLQEVHADGFERTVERWLRRIEPQLAADDDFTRARARQITAAAARFDQTGSRNIAEFVAFMERHVVRDPDAASVVRVMTIHKSKGLGFDLVILPDLQGKRLDERRAGLAVQKAADRSVEWVLDLPPKLFYESDEVLTHHVRGAEADACYEALSLLYVALTRAKRATYALIEPVGKSVSRNYPKLLTETLGDAAREVRIGRLEGKALWSSGDPDWATAITPAAAAPSIADSSGLEPIAVLEGAPAARRAMHRASAEKPGVALASQVFTLARNASTEFGAEVHALLAEVEWGDAFDFRIHEEEWRAGGSSAAAIEEALRCLQAPALAEVWQKPGEIAEVWRERPFEVVLDDTWITGVFDRVVVYRDRGGRAVRAHVYDFKTDAVTEDPELTAAVERHTPQLATYRRVAAIITGLPEGAVRADLVFTRPRRLAAVSGATP